MLVMSTSSTTIARLGLAYGMLLGNVATALMVPGNHGLQSRALDVPSFDCSSQEFGTLGLLMADQGALAVCMQSYPDGYRTVTQTDYVTKTIVQTSVVGTTTATVSGTSTVTVAELEYTSSTSTSTTTITTSSPAPFVVNNLYEAYTRPSPARRTAGPNEMAIAEAMHTAAPEVQENFCACVAQQQGCCGYDDCYDYDDCDCLCTRTKHVTRTKWVVNTANQTTTTSFTTLSLVFETGVVGVITSTIATVATVTTTTA